MTNAKKLIMKYVNKNFVSESVRIDFLNDECVKVTDQTGDELKLTVNLFGDIIDADTRKIYAIGNASHNLAALMLDPTQMPTDWTEPERDISMKEIMILEELKREAFFAQRIFSTELLFETYGKAKMARQLEVITQSEFMEINHMTVYFMNTDKEYIRYCNEKYREGRTLI